VNVLDFNLIDVVPFGNEPTGKLTVKPLPNVIVVALPSVTFIL